MFRNDGPELAAIVDWELATIGDPLLDMGWIMATWPEPDGRSISGNAIEPWGGFPSIGNSSPTMRQAALAGLRICVGMAFSVATNWGLFLKALMRVHAGGSHQR